MKYTLITLIAICSIYSLQAQRSINENIPANGVEKLSLTAEYASVTIKTWDQNTIGVVGTVDVFDNTQNDTFKWTYKKEGTTINIESYLEDLKNEKSHWNKDDDCCNKRQIDIDLTLTIPENIALKMRSTYGSIEIKEVQTSLNILNTYGSIDAEFSRLPKGEMHLESTYSHVDIAIPKSAKASFILKTPYGEVLTDVPLEVKAGTSKSKSTLVAHLNGGGTEVYAEAGYNTIYLREKQ